MLFDQRDQDPWGRKGVRGSHLVFAIFAALGVSVYYAIYKPLFKEPEKYRRIQHEFRKDIDQTKIQPGDMKVWSNPYKPLPKEGQE